MAKNHLVQKTIIICMKVEEFKILEIIKIGEVVLNGSRVLARIVVLKVAKNFTVS